MRKYPKTPSYAPVWFLQIAEVMARTGCTVAQAAEDCEVELTPLEADRIGRRRDFQDILRTEKNKFFSDVANAPGRSKSVAIGKLEILIDYLVREGEYDKAASTIEKLAKLEGWVGAESNVNVFAGLTARDIAEQKEKILAQIRGNQPKPAEA